MWKAANPDKVKAHDHNKRAKRRAAKAATVVSIKASEWQEILRRHGYKCFWCGLGFTALHQDHFYALANGGDHSSGNIVPACVWCNSRKSDEDPFMFANRVGRPVIAKAPVVPSEQSIQSAVLVAVSALDCGIFWRNNTGVLPSAGGHVVRFGLLGSPDILGCFHGKFMGIEVKSARGKLRLSQERFKKEFERAGGIYIVARDPETALRAVLATAPS